MSEQNAADDSQAMLATARMRSEHHRETTRLQHAINGLTRAAAHPLCVPVLSLLILAWIVGNLLAAALGTRPVDPPPFVWLQDVVCIISLYVAILLISTQRREARLADDRSNLILELAILAEQKSAKAIQLLEEYRRDNPMLANRHDMEAQEMAAPADHRSVLDSIKRDDNAEQPSQ